jgi:biopolymer transport protein ExbB
MGTTLGWYREGGPIMLLILLVGAAGLAILIERLYVIFIRSKNNGRAFIERTIQLVRGGKIDEAIKACAESAAALADIGLLILRSRSREEADLTNVANTASLTVLPRLNRRVHYLRALALSALLFGILGTVLGIHTALTQDAGTTTSVRVDVGHALVPTAFGLVVAIALTLGRAYIVSQSESITEEIREFSARLINALIDRPDVRLGHR